MMIMIKVEVKILILMMKMYLMEFWNQVAYGQYEYKAM